MLLGTVLLVLGALIGYWLYTERDHVEARERDRLQTQARVIDENLGHQLEGVNNALAGVRNDFPLSDGKNIGPAVSRRLRALSNAMPGVRTMLLVNAEGSVLASNRDELIGLNASEREYFKVPRERPDPAALYVSPPFKTTLGVFSINVVRAVTGVKGEFSGIVAATLDPDYFNVVLRSVLYAPDMWVSIAHGDGVAFLYMPPNQRAAGIDLTKPGSFFTRHRDSVQTATVMTGTVYATGEERMMAVRTIKPANVFMDKPLVVGVSRDLAAIYAPWRKDVLMDGGLYGVIALTTILGLTFSQRRRRKLDYLEADRERERRESAERQERALRASEEKYRGIFDNLQDLYVETDQDGTILEISPQVETLSRGQYKREDLLGRSATAFYCDPERRAAFVRTLTLLGSVKDFESTFFNRDGSVVPCSISATIRPDAEGKPSRIVSMMRDITARKRAEESLRESEERLRAIFEGALDGILVADAGSGKILTGNPAICRMLGYTLEEFVRHGVSDIHPKQDLAHVIEEFERLQHGKTQEVADFPVIRKDGSTFRADMQLAPIRLGGTDCALAIIRDISERKRAEHDLRESEAKFRSLAEEDLAGVVIIQDGRLKYVNPAIAQMLGYSREELLGASSVLEFVADEDRPLVQGNLRRRPEGEDQSIRYIFRGRKKDGSLAYLEVFGSRIALDGRFAVMSTVLDITERKRAEETQAKLVAIVEHSNDAIIGRALDGTVTSWNAAAERILGYKAAETIGRDPVEIFPPPMQQRIAEYRKRVRAGQMVPSHETVCIAKDGRHIDFAVSPSAIKDNSGRIIGTATTLRDITERKRTEQALHDNAKRLRGLSRRLFTAAETERRNINRELHDRVGQTLAALNMNLNIIRSQLPQQSLDAVGARLQDTQRLLEETAAQVRNVMADLHPPALDDYGLLAALHSYVESLGARFAMPITVRGEDLAPRLPLAAETALFRIAQEALANAAAHGRAKRVQVLLAATPVRVTLTIADDGVGFDAEHAALAHPSWGLVTMRERAEAIGAALRIDTAPGRGTRVVVEIEREAA